MLQSFHVVMMVISLLVIIKFSGRGNSHLRRPLSRRGQQNVSTSEYPRYASKRAISRLTHQKFSWEGGGTALSRTSPPRHLRSWSFVIFIYSAVLHMQQNFKISRPTSEYLRCASICAISRLNNQKISLPRPLSRKRQQNKIGCGYGYGTVSVVGNATGTVPYL